jgi:hypothetical protein
MKMGVRKQFGLSSFRLVAATVVGVAATAGVRPADAALTLTLSEPGFAPQTFIDTGNTGGVSYFGTYGTFSTNFIVGESNKLVNPTSVASLQVESLNVVSLGSGGTTSTLTVTLSDNGYTFPGTAGSSDLLESSVGGTFTSPNAGDGVTFTSSVISPATTTGLQSYTAPSTVVGTTSFSSVATPVGFIDPSTYSLTNVTKISLSGAGESVNVSGSTTVVAAVPEPTTASVAAVAGLALLRRRRRVAAV